MSNKLLVICGPTATGKTSLAISLAKRFNCELVSADSRQVYKGMDIGTGKDLPDTSKFHTSAIKQKGYEVGYYVVQGVRLWGYDLVDPDRDFSVAQYVGISRKIIANIINRQKLPLLVGGTGFYIKGIVDGIKTTKVPRDNELRASLENKSVDELYEMLSVEDPVKAASMNKSDRKNPRRLIRAIEVAKWNFISSDIITKKGLGNDQKQIAKRWNTLFVGLKAPKAVLDSRIKKRVEDRLEKGILDEIIKLLAIGITWDNQSMQAMGYRQWKDYFKKHSGEKILIGTTYQTNNKDINTEFSKAVGKWIKAEQQYAKRQMTWFKNDDRIYWFDITEKKWNENVEKTVSKWHNKN